MLPWIGILAILGLMLVFAEVLIPGFGIFGIFGVISLIGSTMLVLRVYGMLAFLLMIALIIILFFLMILIARKSGLYNKVVLHDRIEGKSMDETKLPGLIGKIGQTQSTLRPYGVACFDGENVDVCSLGDFIDRGKTVKVIQVTGKTVTVKECEDE